MYGFDGFVGGAFVATKAGLVFGSESTARGGF
jgi:hypothetical protein